MKYLDMTLSAQPWVRNFEKPVVDGAMRLMAVGAVLYDRRMFPQERPPSLGVAQVAGFIDTCLLELRGIWSSMRIVAVRTGHLSLPQWHVG